jgi:protease IV
MSKTKTAIFVVVLFGIVLITILLGVSLLWITSDKTVSYEDTILEIDLPSAVAELPQSDSFSVFFQPSRLSLWDIRKALTSAAADEKIKAVYIKLPYLTMGWAQVEEIRDELIRFRDSGKSVHLFLNLDMATEKEIFLASSANEIYMNPTSNLLLDGFMAETVFLKGTMNKLGVIPQFLQLKEYKSAETYSRDGMTPEIRSMYQELLSDIQDHFLLTLSVERGLNLEILENYVNKGLISGDEAVGLGLVDEMGYTNLINEKLKNIYMLPEDAQFISLSNYLLSGTVSKTGKTKARIAVVGASGTIITGNSQSFTDLMGSNSLTRTLSNIRKDKDIDGLILRVNSPGGSAVASDMIWQEIASIENVGKPVVVSMSGVAGSGGYYISMGARKIVCQPTTITGSIGVIFGKFNISGLLDKLGMKVDRVKISPNSDFMSMYSSLSTDQKSLVEEMMTETYEDFVQKAAEGRGIPYEEFEPKAHGRIYSGNQALEAGLVDELGGFSTAVKVIRKELEIADGEKVLLEIYPRPKTIWESFSSGEYFNFMPDYAGLSLRELLEELKVTEIPVQWLLMPEISIR